MNAADRPPDIIRAQPVSLDPREPLGVAVSTILDACLTHWTANAPALITGDARPAIHQMRVGLRRYRSALAIFKPVLDRDQVRGVTEDLKRVLKALGPARDNDVFLTDILGELEQNADRTNDLAVLRRAVERQRDKHVGQARRFVRGTTFKRIAEKVTDWTRQDDFGGTLDIPTALWHRRSIGEYAPLALDRQHRKLLKSGRNFADMPTQQRHDVRITLKKMRYVSEYFATLYPNEQRRLFRKALRRMQDDLGHLNDIAVAEELIAQAEQAATSQRERHAIGRAGTYISGWYGYKLLALEPAMIEDWQTLTSQTPFWRTDRD